jgi:hypothetical protein
MGEQMFTLKSEMVGRLSVVSDDFVRSVDQKICERRRFTISELYRMNLHKFHTLFCTRLSQSRLSLVLLKMSSENFHGCAQNAGNGFSFDFFRATPQRWR